MKPQVVKEQAIKVTQDDFSREKQRGRGGMRGQGNN